MPASPHRHAHGTGVDERDHEGGILGAIRHLMAPHSHDHAAAIDSATANREGMRALVISLVGLLVTALVQVVVVALSGSVALVADTVHNFSDALTALPLGVAFWLGRRPANRRYMYGYGRAEDLAVPRLADVLLHANPAGHPQAHDRTSHHRQPPAT